MKKKNNPCQSVLPFNSSKCVSQPSLMHTIKGPLIPSTYTVQAADNFRSGLGDVFHCARRADLALCSVGICIDIGVCVVFHICWSLATWTVALTETDEACSFMAQVTVCVSVQNLPRGWASVTDVTGAKRRRRCRLWIVEWDKSLGRDWRRVRVCGINTRREVG